MEAKRMPMKEEPIVPAEMLQEGATIIKLENQTQMAIARQTPRNEAKILSEALRELDLYPSMAREAIYVKPVGKDDTGTQKTAEGLSIRAAESLGNRWANSSYGTEIISEDDDAANIASVFLDYQANTRHVTMARVSKFYKNKFGHIIRYSPDRFDTVLKANGSKLLREVILRSLPAGLKKEYETKARRILKKEPIVQQRQAVVERFADLGVSEEQLAGWKQKPIKEWKRDDILDALGLVNAIRDGETSVETIFQAEAKQENAAPKLEPIK